MPWNGSCCSCCCATFYGLLSQKWAATSKQEVFSCLHPFVKLFLLCVFYHSFLSKFVWCDQANWRNSFQPCMLFYVLHLVSHLVMRNAILYMISFIPLKKYYNTFIKKNCQPKKVKNAELSKCFQLYIFFWLYLFYNNTLCYLFITSLPLLTVGTEAEGAGPTAEAEQPLKGATRKCASERAKCQGGLCTAGSCTLYISRNLIFLLNWYHNMN